MLTKKTQIVKHFLSVIISILTPTFNSSSEKGVK